MKTKKEKETTTGFIYRIGDVVELWDKTVQIVEVLDAGKYHVKNQVEPFDSFITEIGPVVVKEKSNASKTDDI